MGDEGAAAPEISSVVNKLVVNDLLCFVMNKLQYLPAKTVVQLCVSHHNFDDIDLAKSILFETFPGDRYVKRQGDKKKLSSLEDIVKRVTDVGEDLSTVDFVSKRLDLPPINFDSLDVTVLFLMR